MDTKELVIYDIGLHNGEDTMYFLRRGFRVIAVDANLDLINSAKIQFADYIQSGSLSLVYGAITDVDQGEIIFYKNIKESGWGTIKREWADRNKMLGSSSIEVRVPTITLPRLFLEYGKPYYLKLDIEGMDFVALRSILSTSLRPEYVSIESAKDSFLNIVAEFDLLTELGYESFSVVQQSTVNRQRVPLNSKEGFYYDAKFIRGSSGMFGSDLGKWQTKDEALDNYKHIFWMYK